MQSWRNWQPRLIQNQVGNSRGGSSPLDCTSCISGVTGKRGSLKIYCPCDVGVQVPPDAPKHQMQLGLQTSPAKSPEVRFEVLGGIRMWPPSKGGLPPGKLSWQQLVGAFYGWVAQLVEQ
jgi:hypothetical protein